MMKYEFVITDIKMKIKDGNGMKAICNIVVNELLSINDVRIVENKEGRLMVAMPSKKMPGGGFKDMANPVNATARKIIEDAVLAKYHDSTTLNQNILEFIG